MKHLEKAKLLLRIGIAFVFFYAALGSILNPDNWIGYFPAFLKQLLPQNILLISFSIYELFLGIWLLSHKKIFYASLLSAVTLTGIIIFNLPQIDITFRDIAIVFASISLALLSKD